MKSYINGTIDHISDIVTDENNLPYKTVHFLHTGLTADDIDIEEFFDALLLDELDSEILTKDQVHDLKRDSDNSFQSVIVFYDYKALDRFKLRDFVHVIFDDYNKQIATGSSFSRSILKVGLYITRDYRDCSNKLFEYINAEVEGHHNN